MVWEGNGGGRSQVLVAGESEAARLDGMVCAALHRTAPLHRAALLGSAVSLPT